MAQICKTKSEKKKKQNLEYYCLLRIAQPACALKQMKKGSHKREATWKVSQKEVQTFRHVSSYFMEVQFVIMIMEIKKKKSHAASLIFWLAIEYCGS